jgi:hypothetical protein
MARKPKSVETAPAVPPAEGLWVTEGEMLRLQNAMLRGEAARLRADSLRVARAALLARIDPEGHLVRLDTQISVLVAADAQAKVDFDAVRSAIGERLGINIEAAAIDPASGAVVLPEAPTPPGE